MAIPLVLPPEEIEAIQAQQAADDAKASSYWGASMPPAGPPAPMASFGEAPATPPPPAGPPAIDYASMSPAEKYAAARAAQTPTHTGAILGAGPPAPEAPPSGPARAMDGTRVGASDFKVGATMSSPPEILPNPVAGLRPSAAENAQFEAFKAKPHAAPRAAGAGGGGAPNADPYGVGSATKRLLGTYDAAADAARRGLTAEGDKALMIGDHHAELARRREEDAAIASAEEDFARKHFDDGMAELQSQLDDVKAKKLDPLRKMKESPALAVSAVVGGILGGLYMGVTKGQENPFLRDLNRQIDRQMDLDSKEIDTDKFTIGQSMSLLGQQRQIHRDTEIAKLASRNLYYEAAKDQILAEAAQYDSPVYQARADAAVAEIQKPQAELQLKLAQAKQAQAQAAASQAHSKDKEVIATYRDVYDKALAAGLPPQQAEYEAKRQIQLLYAPGTAGERAPGPATGGANPIANVSKDLRSEAAKEWQSYAAAQQGKKSLEQAFSEFEKASAFSPAQIDVWKAGVRGIVKPHMKGANSDADLEKLIEPFVPGLTDSAETRNRKLGAAKATLIDAGVATPILDQASPGWRGPAPVQHLDSKGNPVK